MMEFNFLSNGVLQNWKKIGNKGKGADPRPDDDRTEAAMLLILSSENGDQFFMKWRQKFSIGFGKIVE